jgi:hypothetical protein
MDSSASHLDRLDRRALVRGLGTGALALAAAPLLHRERALAGILWCRTDPVLAINGRTYHVYVSGPQDLLTAATGPTRLRVTVGGNVSVSLSTADAGFGRGWSFGLSVSSGLQTRPGPYYDLRVSVYVPADGDYPIRVETLDAESDSWSSVDGRTNSMVYATGVA